MNALLHMRDGERRLAALISRGENRMGGPALRLEVVARERAEAVAPLAVDGRRGGTRRGRCGRSLTSTEDHGIPLLDVPILPHRDRGWCASHAWRILAPSVFTARRHGATSQRYFTAPAVSPPTMYFCKNRNNAITGIAASTAPAAKTDQLEVNSSET